MDAEEYERLRWEDVQQQLTAHEEYQNSLAGQLEWLLRDLAEQTFSLEQAAIGLERALEERRDTVRSRWKSESEAKACDLLARANMELGEFSSFDALWRELQRAEPWEKSLRRDLYDEWVSFQHYFDQDHLAELSTETDSLLRYGGIIAAYAVLETYISKFCVLLRSHGFAPDEEKESRPKGPGELRRNRKFLARLLGERTGAASWEALDVFIEMRHCIAHRSGLVDGRLFPKYQHHFGPGKTADIVDGRLVPFRSTVEQFSRAIHELFDVLYEAACRRRKLRIV